MKKNYVFSSVVMLSLAFLTTPTLTAQNIGINANGAAPDAGAMLDISSTNKGLLIPRVNITNLNTIAPITGSATVSMLVYNTNATTGQGYYYWNGATWVRLSTGDAWQLTGNAGTNATTNFLGTTDNIALRIRTNNANRFEFTTNGHFRSFNGGSAAAPTYSWTGDPNTGVYNPSADVLAFSTGGVDRIRIGEYTGSIGIGRVPCCGSLGGPIVDVYEPMEIGNDAGTNRQARIGYWYGGDVAIDPEVDGWGYVGYISRAWWGMYSYGFVNVSERKKKKEITPINQNEDIEKIVMQDIEKINPSFYYYKQQNNTPSSSFDTRYRPHFQLGVIVDESPDYLLDESFTGVDIYAVASLSLAGVKYNHKKIQEIENKLTHSLTINDFGSVQENNNKVFVKYSEEFISQLNGANPIINITPISEKEINLRIVQKTNDGFIVAANSDEKIISFDWIAIAKVNTVKEDENSDSTTVDDSLLKKIHLTPEEKQKAIEHYSNIKNSLTPQTE
mgnify:CR=1 FL=1